MIEEIDLEPARSIYIVEFGYKAIRTKAKQELKFNATH
jgi:hypothetical protein